MRLRRVAASHSRFDAAGRTATQLHADCGQQRSANSPKYSRCGALVFVVLGLLAFDAPRVVRSELVATMSFYSVNAFFDASDCQLLDSYVTQSLLDKNVPIDFSDPTIYRTNCTSTNYSGRVKSVLIFNPIFDGLSALVSPNVSSTRFEVVGTHSPAPPWVVAPGTDPSHDHRGHQRLPRLG
jgi:hypothetical protein